MSCQKLVVELVMAGLVALAGCSDTPVAPPVDRATSFQFPPAAQSPLVAFAQPPVIPTGPRVEVYSNGVLRQVFSAATPGAAASAGKVADIALPPNFTDLMDALARKPVNQRTAHFVEVMRTLAAVPSAARGQAIEAISRQLLRETEHKDTTLADGTRVLEYYFDHQLATRVVLAATPTSGRRRLSGIGSGVETPVTRETVTDPDATYCSDCYNAAYDEMLWASVTWFEDQLSALSDIAGVDQSDEVAAKLCLTQMAAWALSMSFVGAAIGNAAENWALITTYAKQDRLNIIAALFGAAVASWVAMHNCFHT